VSNPRGYPPENWHGNLRFDGSHHCCRVWWERQRRRHRRRRRRAGDAMHAHNAHAAEREAGGEEQELLAHEPGNRRATTPPAAAAAVVAVRAFDVAVLGCGVAAVTRELSTKTTDEGMGTLNSARNKPHKPKTVNLKPERVHRNLASQNTIFYTLDPIELNLSPTLNPKSLNPEPHHHYHRGCLKKKGKTERSDGTEKEGGGLLTAEARRRRPRSGYVAFRRNAHTECSIDETQEATPLNVEGAVCKCVCARVFRFCCPLKNPPPSSSSSCFTFKVFFIALFAPVFCSSLHAVVLHTKGCM